MAWPTKRSRRICVEGRSFRWRVAFSTSGSKTTVTIVVADYEQPSRQLRVPLLGFWEYGLLHREREAWKELRVEPRLVGECIRFALLKGWDPCRAAGHVKIVNAALLLPEAEFRVPFPMAEPPGGWSATFERLEKEQQEAKQERRMKAQLDLVPDKTERLPNSRLEQ